MHSTYLIALACFVATSGAFLLGFVIAGILARERDHLDAQQLAERADTHGRRLISIARELRRIANDERRDYTTWPALAMEWAGDLEAVAAAHLQCINAIGLEQLHAVGYHEPWLGDFVPHLLKTTPQPDCPHSGLDACESGAPDCGPGVHYDADLNLLCGRCWTALEHDNAESVANGR